jgi:hypothetical protein
MASADQTVEALENIAAFKTFLQQERGRLEAALAGGANTLATDGDVLPPLVGFDDSDPFPDLGSAPIPPRPDDEIFPDLFPAPTPDDEAEPETPVWLNND